MEIANTTLLNKDRVIVSNPEEYNRVEIRNLNYDDGEGLAGYNGNVIVGYGNGIKDVFFLSINKIKEGDMEVICDKVLEQFGQDNELINLMIFNGESTIYTLNDGDYDSRIFQEKLM
jgi:hypothetical protein